MKRNNILPIVSMVVVLISPVFALARDDFGDMLVVPNSDWPQGTVTAVESPGRVYSVWVNGDERFYFHGDTKAFNLFLKKFAAIEMPVHRLILEKRFNQVKSLDGRMSLRYDWLLHIPSGIYLDKLTRDNGSDSNEIHPSLLVSMHSNRIDLNDVVLPPNVQVMLPDGKPVSLPHLSPVEPAMEQPSGQTPLTAGKKELELCGEAQTVLADFYDALSTGRELKALLLCSKNVQTKAAEYDSAHDFFADVVPVKKLTQNYPQSIRGLSKRSGRIVRYNFEARLTVPDEQESFEWSWSIVREPAGWAVDFETKPLKLWLKHAVMARMAANDKFRQDPAKLRVGLKITLIPQAREYVVGKPMLFDIEMKNTSDETLMYMKTSWMVNNPMRVTGPDGNDVPYIDSSYQTMVGSEFIEPGQTIKLVDNYDVRLQYHIIKPGRYAFQFTDFRPEIPSNVVEIEVKQGQLSDLEIITEKLREVLPDGWILTRSQRPTSGDDIESDTPYVVVHMIGERSKKGKGPGIELIMLIGLPSDDKVTDEWMEEGLKYWGQSKFGPVYVMSSNPQQLWLTYQQDIWSALDIE